MSWRKALWAAGFLAGVLLAAASLRAQGNYLDVYIAKVKPEKAADAETIAKKIADANRNNNGDHVLAMETLYGEGYTYVFVTQRQDYADVDKGNDSFMGALNKAFGKQGAEKVFSDWNSCLVSSHSELRLRRPDLSSKMPKDPQSFAKLVGESRVLRTISVHVRPGHLGDFEALLKDVNAHADRNPDTRPVLISQLVEGGQGDTFYISFLRSSLAGMDKEPTLKDILGEEGLAKFEKSIAETAAGSQSAIYRFRPDMSYPPQEISDVAADYWQPKPAIAATAKPKAKTSSGADVKPAAAKLDAKPNQ
jgi:hypothetical protein